MSSGIMLERPRRSASLPVGRIGVEYQRDGAASGIQAKSTVTIKYDITGKQLIGGPKCGGYCLFLLCLSTSLSFDFFMLQRNQNKMVLYQ